MTEIYTNRKRLAAAGLALVGSLSLSGCSDGPTNYAGTGNEYQVKGIVHDVESDRTIHINERRLKVVSAAGKASKWFRDGKGQDTFSEEFNFDPDYNQEESGWFGDCEHGVTVGKVYDLAGEEMDARLLRPGDPVMITGHIREENIRRQSGKTSYCGTQDKAVFDTVRITGDRVSG